MGFKRSHHETPSVIRQKGESQNGSNKTAKHAKFSEKRTFFTLIRTSTSAYDTWTFHTSLTVDFYDDNVFELHL